jgi:hypothetical protein
MIALEELDSLVVGADLVAKLLADIPYLSEAEGGTCRNVHDTRTAMSLTSTVAPPAVLVEYGGDDSDPPKVMTIARQIATLHMDLFMIARTFDANAEEGPGMIGVQQIARDVKRSLIGYILPSVLNTSGAPYVKLWHVRNIREELSFERVVYRSQWRCTGLQAGAN